MGFDSIATVPAGLGEVAIPVTAETAGTCHVSPVLVGRADELAMLDAAFADVGRGAPVTLLIGGEAGVGKTRLLTEFAGRLTGGGRALFGGCLELGASGLPFAPFTAVLRQLVREQGADGVRGLLAGRQAGELGRLLPELGEPSGPGVEAYQGEARARLFEQMLALFEGLARAAPLALIIDDAHWADRSSRDLLTFLIGNQQVLPGLLIVVTFRSDELHRTHPLRPLLAELGRIGWVDRRELPRLTRQEAAAQMAAILAHEPAAAEVDLVFRRSEGNPLFVEHLIGCELAVPSSLRDMVLATIQRLPEETRDLLRVASPGGTRVGHALLAEVSGLDDADLSRALRPAVAANVLIADSNGYLFRHALIQEVMHEDLLPGEHSQLHARYAGAISADNSLMPDGRVSISLAHHWYSAHDLTRALSSAWQAAADAGHALAHSEQLSMLARVLELWDRVPDAAQRIGVDHVRVLEEAVAVSLLTWDSERGSAFASAALDEIDVAADPARAALLLNRRASVASDGSFNAARDDLREALRLVSDGRHEAARAQVLASMATFYYKQHADSQARACAEEALAIAREQNELATQSTALLSLALLEPTGSDGGRKVLDLLAQARATAEVIHDHRLLVMAAINESHVLEGLGRHLQAAEVARTGLRAAASYGLSRTSGALLAVNVAEPLMAAGRWDEASDVIAKAIGTPSIGAQLSDLWVLAGLIALGHGDIASAEVALARSSDVIARSAYCSQTHLPHARLQVEFYAARQQYAAALSAARTVMADHDLLTSPRYTWPLFVAAAQVVADVASLPVAARADADADLANAVLRDLRGLSAELEAAGPVQIALQLTFRAELARTELARPEIVGTEHPERECQLSWQAAVDAWEELGEPLRLGAALCGLAEAALNERVDREQAARSLRRAAGIATELGAGRLLADVRLLARRGRIDLAADVAPRRAAGDGTHPGSPSVAGPAAAERLDRHGLTPREFEVLCLVAGGLSNAAIADELFISVKTVSVHVSNIMAKLGAGSRGEAAAVAHRLRLLDDAELVGRA